MAKLMLGAAGMGEWIRNHPPNVLALYRIPRCRRSAHFVEGDYFPEAALRLLPTGLSHTLQMPPPRQGTLNLLITTAC